VVPAGFGSLHDGDPLVVVAKEGQVEVGAAAVGLGTDRQLGQQALHSLYNTCIGYTYISHCPTLEYIIHISHKYHK